MNAAILGRKLGMTSLYSVEGVQIPCTVIKAGPCPVVQVKNAQKDGYEAIQVGFEPIEERKVNRPEMGHFKNAGLSPLRTLREFRGLENQFTVGDTLTVEQFVAGDKVKVVGKSKGRGFQGVVKRHHFGGVGMTTHGQSDRQRHPGSVGSSSYPSRVLKGLRMAGRMGGKRVSIRNVEVVEVMPEQNLILLKGGLPGAVNSLLEIIK